MIYAVNQPAMQSLITQLDDRCNHHATRCQETAQADASL